MRSKLLYVVTEDWYFWSHRLPIARAALQAGYDVLVATRVNSCAQKITEAGFRLVPLDLDRSSYSPRAEVRSIRQLEHIYRREQPQIVHHVALKPVLYGSIAAFCKSQIQIVNAFAGLGYLAASTSLKAKLLRSSTWRVLRFLMRKPETHFLLQNAEDKALLIKRLALPPEKITIIRGSGVNVNQFKPTPEPEGVPIVLFASRMLWIKGVQQFIEAAQLLRRLGVSARFVLAGESDTDSPSCVPRQQLLDWEASGAVEWWGRQQDMSDIFKRTSLVCLPSHGGEGVPKVLMEAAASGRAIIATDVPGCRDVVRDGVNGLLVPPKKATALADAIRKLLSNRDLRLRMGFQGRQIALSEFSEEVVVRETLALYNRLLGAAAPSPSPVESRQLSN